MYMVIKCPKHQKALVFYKETSTHSLFKCPDCDYVDYPGVVHNNLPDKYNDLKFENKCLREAYDILVDSLDEDHQHNIEDCTGDCPLCEADRALKASERKG